MTPTDTPKGVFVFTKEDFLVIFAACETIQAIGREEGENDDALDQVIEKLREVLQLQGIPNEQRN